MAVVSIRGTVPTPDERSAINNDFISKIKNSVAFGNNWNATYNHIPTSMSFIAKCNAYAAMPATSTIDFGQLKDFSLFKSTSLAACLDEIVNATQLAFNCAETSFSGISDRADGVFDILDERLFPGLGDLELTPSQETLRFVSNAVETLQTDATAAKTAVTAISQSFDKVLQLALEMRRASIEYANMAEKTAKSAQLLAYSKSIELQGEMAGVKTDLESVTNCKGVLADTQAAYNKASKDMPTVGQAVGYGIAMAFTDAATSVLTQFVGSYVNNKNNSGKSQQNINTGSNNGPSNPNGQNGSGYPDINPPKNISDQGDPAYALAQKDNALIATLSSLVLNGVNNDIDWQHARTAPASNTSGAPPTEPDLLSAVIDQLKFAQNSSSLTNAAPSIELKGILTEAIALGAEIEAVSLADKTSEVPPAPDAQKVQGWQENMKDVVRRISSLCAQSNAAPGSGGAVGATRPAAPVSADAAATDAAGSASSLMAIAQQNMSTAQAGLSVALENYTASTTKLANDQIALGKARSEMLTAQSQEKTLEEVVALLTLVTAVMLEFNTEINDLVLHFEALVELVTSVMDNNFNPFLNDLQIEMDASQKDISSGGLGGIHPGAVARHTIYVSGCTMAAYFDLFGDVASTWIEMSKQCINANNSADGAIYVINKAGAPWPAAKPVTDGKPPQAPANPPDDMPTGLAPPDTSAGVKAVEWNADVKRELDSRLSAIETWAQKATTNIQAFIDKNNKAAMGKIQAHLDTITSKLRELPEPLPAHVAAGAAQGASTASATVKDAVNQSTSLATVPDMAYGNNPYGGKASRGG